MTEDPTFETDEVFDRDYLYFYADRIDDERSKADTDFLVEALEFSPGDRVLDVACGHGRIANRLAARGPEVAGLDQSDLFLNRAREDAGKRGVADSVAYVRGDMRALPWPDSTFDAAVSLFTSFGYFDEEGNRTVLEEVGRVLRPGGQVLLDVVDRDSILEDFTEESVLEVEGDYLIDRHEFDPRTGRTTTDRTTVRDGEVREMTYSVRTYSYTELATLLESVGFEVVADYGNTDGEEYSLDTSRLVLVGRYTG